LQQRKRAVCFSGRRTRPAAKKGKDFKEKLVARRLRKMPERPGTARSGPYKKLIGLEFLRPNSSLVTKF
jgi:hypothetical protein